MPETLELAEIGTVTLHECLRNLPGRRAVHRATSHDGQLLLVKRFLHPYKAAKDAQQEWRAIESLRKRSVPTPKPRCLSQSSDNTWVVATNYLEGAETLTEHRGHFAEFLKVIRKGHHGGAMQEDLHFDNFLVHQGLVYCIDAASFRFFPRSVPDAARQENLALLKANVPLSWHTELGMLSDVSVKHYRQALHKRIHKFAKKCERSCSAFKKEERPNLTLWRTRDCPDWIEEWLNLSREGFAERGNILKDGASCLVVQHQEDWVFKRRSYKGVLPWPWQRRSRARRSWIAGNVLQLLGIATPKPWVCWEIRKQGRLVSDGLLMSSDSGIALHEWVRKPGIDPKLLQKVAAGFRVLFGQFDLIDASHGDTKASNFRVGPQGDIRIIDLDSFTLHKSGNRADYMAKRDHTRFKKNRVKYPQGELIFSGVDRPIE